MQYRRVAGALALAACYSPPPDACGLTCTTTCPDGFTCSDGLCVHADGRACPLPSLELASFGVGASFACGLDTTGAIYCWGDNRAHQLGTGDARPDHASPSRVGAHAFTALAVGAAHACGLASGQALCWGDNSSGQALGGTSGPIATPQPVAFVDSPPAFSAIAAGAYATCALGAGQVWCWGRPDLLGDGGAPVSYGVHVTGPDDFQEVSVGHDHACALSASEGVMCWGSNDHGQVAPGQPSPVPAPVQVVLPGVAALHVSAGESSTCAIASPDPTATAGELWCWGRNEQNVPYSLPGAGQTTDLAIPTQVGSDATWTAIRSNERTACGVRDGQAVCWGSASHGALGDGYWVRSRVDLASERAIGPADAIDVSIGGDGDAKDDLGCLRAGTHLACWGQNTWGELGQGAASQHATPVEVPAPAGRTWASVVAGRYHTCALADDGSAYCWGYDGAGAVRGAVARGESQPCLPTEPCDAAAPERAPGGGDRADELIAGFDYTCVRRGGDVTCWGRDFEDTNGPNAAGDTPAPVPGSYTRLFGGDRASCGLDAGGQLACWGDLAGVDQAAPAAPGDPELHDPLDVRFGDDFGCLTRSDGARVCWGDNSRGELGDGTLGSNPAPPPQETGVAQVVANYRHACELVAGTGAVSCWGDNDFDEAGQPGGGMVTSPAGVASATGPLAGCTAVSTGVTATCAICGNVPLCWGYNTDGELGRGAIGAPDPVAAPVAVPDGHTWRQLAVSGLHACALDQGGRLFCWGSGEHGELGDGAHASPYPVPVAT